MKYRKLIFVTVILTGIVYVIIKIIGGFFQTLEAFKEDLPIAHSISSEDSSLFSKKSWDKLEADEVFRSKVRNPVVFLLFDQAYNLIMYRIDLSDNKSLKNLIFVDSISVDRSTGVTYTVVSKDIFSFQYKSGTIDPVSEIWLTLSGDSITINQKSDTLIGFHLLCKNFSIRYKKKYPIDIFFEKENISNSKIPMDILFIKRKGQVILFVLVPNDLNKRTAPHLLKDIISGEG